MFNSYHIKRIKRSLCNKKMTSIMITNQCIKSVTSVFIFLIVVFPLKITSLPPILPISSLFPIFVWSYPAGLF